MVPPAACAGSVFARDKTEARRGPVFEAAESEVDDLAFANVGAGSVLLRTVTLLAERTVGKGREEEEVAVRAGGWVLLGDAGSLREAGFALGDAVLALRGLDGSFGEAWAALRRGAVNALAGAVGEAAFAFDDVGTVFALEDAVAVCSFDVTRTVFSLGEVFAALVASTVVRVALGAGRVEGTGRGRAAVAAGVRLVDETNPDLPKRAVARPGLGCADVGEILGEDIAELGSRVGRRSSVSRSGEEYSSMKRS